MGENESRGHREVIYKHRLVSGGNLVYLCPVCSQPLNLTSSFKLLSYRALCPSLGGHYLEHTSSISAQDVELYINRKKRTERPERSSEVSFSHTEL